MSEKKYRIYAEYLGSFFEHVGSTAEEARRNFLLRKKIMGRNYQEVMLREMKKRSPLEEKSIQKIEIF